MSGRKKKAPPPPPSLSSANSAASITSSISTPPNSDIAEVVVNASSIKRVVELPKSHSSGKLNNNSNYCQALCPRPFKNVCKPLNIETLYEEIQNDSSTTTSNYAEYIESVDNKYKEHVENVSNENEMNPVSGKKLSIFVPPPPQLNIDRNESNESWNNFITRLGQILDSRVGELV